ncbi:hypothetical protein A7981_02680 [Methylovorus sp. MM2]|uniref:ankyrin repeat domain-containing protein n=1 Tax=Methylovorus sp. MM2 TaxID=1848038 RepID=UPI0007E0965F|nr:ankyrin repeat domain-containing protein [Methylovorus sp. MM2]OAM52407.1 hypothetical protein A7981_02680 [Methylovorus sp. MM2]
MTKETHKFTKHDALKALGTLLILAIGYKFGIPAFTIYSAKHDLEKIGVPFSEQKFVESACNGDQGTVQLFVQADMNINVLAAPGKNDGMPKSALHCAASQGRTTMAKSLIEQGANINIQDEEGNTPLWYVAKSGGISKDGVNHSIEMATLLIKHKADVNLQGDKGGPFLTAIASNQTELADYLIEKGADVKSRNKEGYTALMAIAQNYYGSNKTDRIERARGLVKAGVDVNAQTKTGYTALTIACSTRQYPMIEALLDLGADPNISNSSGQTVIISSLYDPETFNLLIKHGANLNVKVNGSTLLHQAIISNNSSILSLLLASGKIDVNAKNDNGDTALFLTTLRGNGGVMQQLLVNGANPNITNTQLQTPLTRSVINNAIDLTRILIEWNSNINAKDINGHTALFYAKQRYENISNSQSYANKPIIYDGKVFTPEQAPMPERPMPATAPSSGRDGETWRRLSPPNYRTLPPLPVMSSKAPSTDPMIDLLVKAGAHL